jgi:hypothetical protein
MGDDFGFDDSDDSDDFDDDLDLYGDDEGEPLGPVPKPTELLALDSVAEELFGILRAWFDVPDQVTLDLRSVDAAVAELGDPQMVAAMAMRKLQALHLLATPGVRTTTDVVVAIVNDLERALIQAPNMWLKRRALATDWDRAFQELSGEHEGLEEAPVEADEVDPEFLRFRTLHAALHAAMFAVIEVSEGEIREFE